MASITKYVLDHWRGQNSLLWSFAVNGVALYFLMVLLLLGFNVVLETNSTKHAGVFWALVALFFVGMIWSLVGIARASWKALLDPAATVIRKGFAVILVVLVASGAVTLLADFVGLW